MASYAALLTVRLLPAVGVHMSAFGADPLPVPEAGGSWEVKEFTVKSPYIVSGLEPEF